MGAMGAEKGKRSIGGALNTIPKIKHLKKSRKIIFDSDKIKNEVITWQIAQIRC